ncbi:hypothetical protein FHS85_001740 [Rhodoligotrophos appendicifer]|uniref:hypothetical protein n=1 Tax=Rhodoligotrophos appendicifer TaxID=987056 RepID=UPI0011857387|nr:hypothetical protein [Rhodoligotrophos appendicifer]
MTETLYIAPGIMRAGGAKFDTAKDYLTARASGYGMAGEGPTFFFTTHDNHPGCRYAVNGFARQKTANSQPTGEAQVTMVEPASSRVVSAGQRGLTLQSNAMLITDTDGRVVLDTAEKFFAVTDQVSGTFTPETRDRGDKGVEDYALADVTPGSRFVVGTLTFTNPETSAIRWMNAGGTFISFWAKNSTVSGPSVNAIRGLTWMVNESDELILRDNYNNGQASSPIFEGMAGNLIAYNLLIGTFI